MLKNKVAIVTGARRGIGFSIAKEFSKNGATVIVSDINQKECDKAAKKIDNAIGIACDVSDKNQVDVLVEKTLEEFGSLAILVNNAGIVKFAPFLKQTEKDYDSVLAVDLKGTFLCSQAAAKQMKKGGKIVNIASIAGKIAYPQVSPYCAAKSGVINLTRAMAIELAPKKINVNAIAPGVIKTEMTKDMLKDKKQKKATLSAIPLNKIGKPEDIANAAVFLASSKADYITGETLTVDGGWTIQ